MNGSRKLVGNVGLHMLLGTKQDNMILKVLSEVRTSLEDLQLDINEVDNMEIDEPIPTLNHDVYIPNQRMIAPAVFEPIRPNRFIVVLPEDVNIPEWSVESVTMPQWVGSWLPIELKIRNLIGPSTSQAIFHRLMHIGNFELLIQMLDQIGNVVQQWTIYVNNIQSIDFGGVSSYYADGISIMTVVLNVNNCVLNF